MTTNTNTRPIQVMILTKAQCAFCDDAKALLERLEAEYPLSIEIRDVDTPEGTALATRGGMLFPPGIFLDGEPFSYGRLSERKVRRELEQRIGQPQPNQLDGRGDVARSVQPTRTERTR